MATLALALALQIQVAGIASGGAATSPFSVSDSLRDAGRARDAQAWFERHRRMVLPWGFGSEGRCDARIGRFCWWYDESASTIPPEPEAVTHTRAGMLATLDSVGRRHPGEGWANGMRVYYHVEAHELAAADSAAHECRAEPWWCESLLGYAAHARGAHAEADSAFARASALMPLSVACQWRDITALLTGAAREEYERASCADRTPIESRYWLLSAFRFGVPGDEWHAEFLSRRVIAELASHAVTPHPLRWGDDASELLLRYGWPVAWSREQASAATPGDFNIVGHDPTPSFALSPREALLASDDASGGDEGWDVNDRQAAARYASAQVSRIVPLAAQVARFRRGDSTLVVVAFAAGDDSLRAPSAIVAAADDRGIERSARDSLRDGRLRVVFPRAPRIAAVEVMDSTTHTLGRARRVYATAHDGASTLSDLLLFRGETEQVVSVDDALSHAIAGDTVTKDRPVGIFWETYDAADDSVARELSILVERVDHGVFQGVRQRLGLADPDSPVRVRWSEPRLAAAGRSARAVSLDLSALPSGRYRVTLAYQAPGASEQRSAREFSLRDR